ncbi:hypothetical protein CSB93_4311 [Pseudomonas paraeruginosa]|uniref:Uncharacterized protein n=1 Tax=Pseudomonas paraeruginosa TaxID=2994495 RepID=A0A2R3J3B8_9PSED|nr:hypothetical protein CSB93_4311 [Pseudomonas paraeruginosa]
MLRTWVGRSGRPTIRPCIDNRLIKAAHMAISHGYRLALPARVSQG